MSAGSKGAHPLAGGVGAGRLRRRSSTEGQGPSWSGCTGLKAPAKRRGGTGSAGARSALPRMACLFTCMPFLLYRNSPQFGRGFSFFVGGGRAATSPAGNRSAQFHTSTTWLPEAFHAPALDTKFSCCGANCSGPTARADRISPPPPHRKGVNTATFSGTNCASRE